MGSRIKFWLILFVTGINQIQGQVINPGMTDQYDSVAIGKVSIEGYVDAYFLYDFSSPPFHERPYAVSSNRDHEFNINLAYVDFKYRSENLRARLIPGFGNYINANYAAESGTLKNLVEANAGVLIWPKKKIWLDAGVLGSPFTNESAISKDHLMYSRALAPEYVPYFITGVKTSVPVNEKANFYFYILNGWQNIQDENRSLSLAAQLEYRPNQQWLINFNVYGGDEKSVMRPNFRNRWFFDLYAVWKSKGRWTATACTYFGLQQTQSAPGERNSHYWGQANAVLQYAFNSKHSLAARLEYFHDPSGILINSINPILQGFNTAGWGICYNLNLFSKALFRMEYRGFQGGNNFFFQKEGGFKSGSGFIVSNLTVWF